MKKSLLQMSFVLALSSSAYADSIEFGAATRCDRNGKLFELAAVVEFNEQTTVVTSNLLGVQKLTYGEHKLSCRVGQRFVTATVKVHEASNGHCMGAGYVSLSNLAIGGTKETTSLEEMPFNFKCTEGEMQVSVLVRDRPDLGAGAIDVQRCVASDWTWEAGYVGLKCEVRHIR